MLARPAHFVSAARRLAAAAASTAAATPALVTVERRAAAGVPNAIAVVTLNKPAALNALCVTMGDQFVATMKALKDDASLRAVILTGAGRAFSAGGDLAFLQARTESSAEVNVAAMRAFYERFLSVRSLPVPVIAAINGHAVGAGLCLALATDVRIAQRGAKLGVNFLKLGLHPGMGSTFTLPALVGPQAAAKLLLGADLVDATEAHELGLVAAVADSAVDAALPLAARIASNSPAAVRATVRTLRTSFGAGLDAALWREADAQAHSYATRDMREGLSAVRDKREPLFGPEFNAQVRSPSGN
eukprot:a180562_9.p1 GENE.a180562_9~~a180562_9.p1  ORF type:complete len:311 (+),score=91.99 a180562_9:30-935(+)